MDSMEEAAIKRTPNIAELITAGVGVVEPKETKPINGGMFQIRGANERMYDASQQPESRRLYNNTSFIFENELTLCFASTGLGKTIFAVQMANEIAKTDKVLYLDLELSDVQFRKRYTDEFGNDYQFNKI